MTKKQSKGKKTDWSNIIIILLSTIGLTACVAVIFPQIRQMIMDFAALIYQREASMNESWLRVLLSFAMGGIFIILFFDYCTLTVSGKALVNKTRQEIMDCLSGIDYRSFVKPALILFGIYLLGILTIIRANYLYIDDIGRAAYGYREWHNWSRYFMILLSFFVHPEINITDSSPLPQLIAILFLTISSVLLIYIIAGKKITTAHLIASIPLGLSPYFLECLSFKFDCTSMSFSILASIFPFLFMARKRAFIFCSILSLLIMCMTYQAASGVYLLIVVIVCFQEWNKRKKTNKEILSFLSTAAFSYCFALLFFRLFLMKPLDSYVSNEMHPVSQIASGVLSNIKDYVIIINNDFGVIWKTGIVFVLFFFIIKSLYQTTQNKLFSLFVSILLICILFILSYGVYSLLTLPMFSPRALLGFGVFLSIMCIYVVSDYKKSAAIVVLALNWCFFVFAFSYGNALADQNRYANFRTGIILHDLSVLYPDNIDNIPIQINNSIGYTPTVQNIARHNPVIERLVPVQLEENNLFSYIYFHSYHNFGQLKPQVLSYSQDYEDFKKLDLPVVLDSYYHTIKSDGNRILVVLKDSSFQ